MKLKSNSELRKILLKELSACVKCGSCHVLCPLYNNFRTEFSGMRGKIAVLQAIGEGSLKTSPSGRKRPTPPIVGVGKKIPDADVAKILENCLGCLGCKVSCPNSVNTDLIRILWDILSKKRTPKTDFTWTFSDSGYFPYPRRGRACPTRKNSHESKKIVFFSSRNADLVGILKAIFSKLGEMIHFLQFSSPANVRARQAMPLQKRGNFDLENRISFIQELLKKFSEITPEKIIFSNPEELYIFKESYRIFNLSDEENRIIGNCTDIFTYLNEKHFPIRRRIPGNYFLLDSCTLVRGLKIKTPQRKILEKILEHPPSELAKDSFFNCLPDISPGDKINFPKPLLDALMQKIKNSKSHGIVTTCTSYFSRGNKTFEMMRRNFQVSHLFELLAASIK